MLLVASVFSLVNECGYFLMAIFMWWKCVAINVRWFYQGKLFGVIHNSENVKILALLENCQHQNHTQSEKHPNNISDEKLGFLLQISTLFFGLDFNQSILFATGWCVY